MREPIRRTRGAAYRGAVIAIALALTPLGPAAAQSQGDDGRAPAEDLAREGVARIMRALEMLLRSIPQYEMPEVNEDGDIIIRRKNPPEKGTPDKPKTVPEATDT